MRSLFTQIFLWFWLALAVIVASQLALERWARPRPFELDVQRADPFRAHATMVEEALRTGGPVRAKQVIDRLDTTTAVRGELVGPGEKFDMLVGGPPPPPARDLLREVLGGGPGKVIFYDQGPLMAFPVRDSAGTRYAYMMRPALPPPGRARFVRFVGVNEKLRVAVLVTIGGLGCWILARWLTRPLGRIQRATRQLAGGDLSARVGAAPPGGGDEFAAIGHDIDHMAERLERLVDAQRRLLRDVSHELRSPLARVKIALELARRRPGDAELLARIEREADRLNELIGQLLTLSRLETEDAQPAQIRIDLRALVREVVADAGFEASARGCEVRLAGEIDVNVRGAPVLLRSAIENVVRNALRHTAPGTHVDVSVSPYERGERARVIVRDRGPGVTPEDLGRIFEPFYRTDEARDRGRGGAGLGLAISRRAIESHGGTVVARNMEDGGLEVAIELPTGAAPADRTVSSDASVAREKAARPGAVTPGLP